MRLTELKKYIILTIILLIPSLSEAKQAYRGEITLRQPDGFIIQARLRGDENVHVLTDLSGHVLRQNGDGFWCYGLFSPDGTITSSGFIAGDEVPAHILSASSYIPYNTLRLKAAETRRIVASIRRPATRADESADGPVKKRCIILLAEFSDVKMTYTEDDFRSIINTAENSAKRYFENQFQGAYEFTFDIGPVVTLSGKQAYYGNNDSSGNDAKAAEAVEEACRLASEKGVDFSNYDEDGDGEVDNVFLFVAGKDEAECGEECCIWSHSWYLTAANINLVLNGKRIDSYAVSSELSLNLNSGRYMCTTIGTFCHEYSHTLGLMDMYDTDLEENGSSKCLWSSTALMDSGNYNDNGRTPPYYNAIDRDMLGIGRPEIITEGTYELEPVNRNGHYLRYETGNEGEYYLFECRSDSGWDKYAGGTGLAIYHIDKSANDTGASSYLGRTAKASERWYYNEVNCNSSHECADMIEAYPDAVAASQVFFPYERNNTFSYMTSPAFRFWDGTSSPIALSGISRNGENITFSVVSVGSQVPAGVTVTSTEVFQDGAIIRWEADASYFGDATVEWGRSGKETATETVSAYEPGKYALSLDGLQGTTAYGVRIWFEAGGIKGKEAVVNFTTKTIYSGGYPFIFIRNVSRNEDGSFPSGALLPLRIYNKEEDSTVEWYMNGRSISADKGGYYELTHSGLLKAVITDKNGEKDIICKEMNVK